VAIRGTRRYVAGHLWFYPGEALADGWYYATLLRDPIDRFLSQYYFYRAHSARRDIPHSPEVVAAAELDPLAYLQHPQFGRLGTNFQACHFAWRVREAPERLTETQLFDAAVASLREYDLVGIFADVQGFVDTYCDALGVARQVVPHVNATAARPDQYDTGASVLAALRKRSAVDLSLHAWARERLGVQPPPRTWPSDVPNAQHAANFGNRQIVIVSSHCDRPDRRTDFCSRDPIRVTLRGHTSIDEPALTIGIALRNCRGDLLYATNTHWLGVPVRVAAHTMFQWEFQVPPLPPDTYVVTLALHKGVSHLGGCYHWLENAISLTVKDS
jgi:hypothetical protein